MSGTCEVKPQHAEQCQYHWVRRCQACDRKACGKHSVDRDGLILCKPCSRPADTGTRDEELDRKNAEIESLRKTVKQARDIASGCSSDKMEMMRAVNEVIVVCRDGLEAANKISPR